MLKIFVALIREFKKGFDKHKFAKKNPRFKGHRVNCILPLKGSGMLNNYKDHHVSCSVKYKSFYVCWFCVPI